MSAAMKTVLFDVAAERGRQDEKWGGGPGDCSHRDTPNGQRMLVLTEEVGEVARAMLELSQQPFNVLRIQHLYEELVQVAAVAVACAEALL